MPNQLQKRVQARQKAQPKQALARIFNAACACLCAQSSTIKDCKQALRLPEVLTLRLPHNNMDFIFQAA